MASKTAWALAAISTLTIGLAGCGSSSAQSSPTSTSSSSPQVAQAPVSGGTLNVGIDSDFVTLNPAMSSALIDRQAFINIFDPLLKLSPTMTVEPNLVTHWTITNGGKTYTLFLRHGVKFQDGTPFNAQAVIYNWDWEMNPANASPRRSNLALVQSLSAPNPYEVVVNLKAPYSAFLSILTGRTGMISSPTAMKKWGSAYGLHPVGTGPFKFVQWIKNDHMILEKNPLYWQKGKPYLNKIVYTPITNPVQEYNALVTGQVNVIDGVPFQDVSSLSSNSSLKYAEKPGLGYADMELNTQAAPFNNVHNREAINYAINREALNQLLYFGHAIPAYTQFSPASWAYDPKIRVPFSDTLAKEQLVKAGNPHGFSFTLLGDNNPITIQEMQAIQSELAKVGITMHIEPVDFTTLLTDAINGNFQADLLGWSGRPDPDQNSYAFDTTGGSFNDPRYSNPEVDSLLLKAREASSQSVRKQYYDQAAAIVLHQAPYIFLEYTPVIQAWSPSVHGFTVYPDGLMRFSDVWIK
ncbi:ABC transporter substrate-binding protein [Sulfobacillus thermosulfidooxidans]|uniref:ABC transporter substrate-binding protein n=1 Tax=Sulfobacillus thermosulfidooxidans TaxID=28034 RepID=UPI00096BC570|nr:ABC transporter substrate-binding protein [Sulfobacillus thermosulfidooxidans]OLZ10504.1 ABC transporter substrate-binding protein [Sulfobacillus thermosulfidooxidans]OLZ14240.1 ABC transporter substrate-binding protein [Sulfobacillus thermosulfidooxidans]OLZ18983.1 ABC transporter substrate-binding protein [Sulfobacillus thermosulfidooxidans]